MICKYLKMYLFIFHESLETLWLMMGTAYEDNLCLKSLTFLAGELFYPSSTFVQYDQFWWKIWESSNFSEIFTFWQKGDPLQLLWSHLQHKDLFTPMYQYGKRCTYQEKLCSWIFHQHSFWVLQIVKRCISFPHMTIVYVAVWKLLRKHDNNDNHHCHYPGEWLCFCRCLNRCKNSLQHVCRDIITHSKVHAGQNNA